MKRVILLIVALCSIVLFAAQTNKVDDAVARQRVSAARMAQEARSVRARAIATRNSQRASSLNKTRWDMVFPPPYTKLWHIKHKAKKLETKGESTDELWALYLKTKRQMDLKKSK